MLYKMNYPSPLGELLIVSDEKSLIGLWFENQKFYLDTVKEEILQNKNLEILQKTKHWLDRYFSGEKTEISELKLAPKGNEFRQSVWKILCEIPYGQTRTYGEIAKIIAKQSGKKSMSAQAIGNAIRA